MIRYIMLLGLLAGCSGSYHVDVPNSTHEVVQRGESFTYIILRLEFLQDVKQLCEDLHFEVQPDAVRRRTVAECTFERLTLLNFDFGALLDVQNDVCNRDPATLTPDLLQIYTAVCL